MVQGEEKVANRRYRNVIEKIGAGIVCKFTQSEFPTRLIDSQRMIGKLEIAVASPCPFRGHEASCPVILFNSIMPRRIPRTFDNGNH
jgi:hypothetical protein